MIEVEWCIPKDYHSRDGHIFQWKPNQVFVAYKPSGRVQRRRGDGSHAALTDGGGGAEPIGERSGPIGERSATDRCSQRSTDLPRPSTDLTSIGQGQLADRSESQRSVGPVTRGEGSCAALTDGPMGGGGAEPIGERSGPIGESMWTDR